MNYYSFFYFYSSSSLFTVNSSHAFVHVQPCSRAFDPVSVLLNTLAKPAINTKWGKELHKTSMMLMFIIIIIIVIIYLFSCFEKLQTACLFYSSQKLGRTLKKIL